MIGRVDHWRNWGGNQRATPAAVDEPRSLLEVVESIETAATAGQTVKVVASGHSFSDIACTSGRMLRIGALDRIVAIDREAMTATVEAGIPLWRLNEELAKRDLALSNLGDIDRQTIAGATSTGTHGTGLRYGSIAAAIVGLELVTGTGDVVRCSATEEPEIFHCARVGLGVLGVVTRVTLQCEPLFKLQAIEVPKPWDEFLAEWDGLLDANDHVDCYWFPHTDTCTVKTSNRTDAPIRTRRGYKKWKSEIYYGNIRHGVNAAYGRRRPEKIPELARGMVAGFHRTERVDLSYHVFCTTRLVRFVEMEYAIPRAEMASGLRSIRELIERKGLLVDFPVEIRGIGPDDIPLSMGSGRQTCYLAVHLSRGTPFEQYFRGVESIMDGLGGRPHWGKMHFQTASSLAPRYPEWSRFHAVRKQLDPDGRFASAFADRVLGSS
ncbi:MAG: D-arabinono-1,4-lactone oxidase [Acidimicrobiia bacterium]